MMRQTYIQERKKVVTCKKSGAGAADVYIPNLYYFEVIDKLLRGSGIDPRALTDTIVDEPHKPYDISSDNENILEFTEMDDDGSRSPAINSPITNHIATTLQSKTPKRFKKNFFLGTKFWKMLQQ
ncbi:uncharacterized protein LOC130898566 [Diorhabda carinulata]|uniref:uncharacterized protein LOC130898566 n=1 Tax=Diorhabda carinulata TaxID=1163345 RepID=UPI00259FE5BB|nr:uncharacterized protein LOC130898566 [Diorhabda carinulata]